MTVRESAAPQPVAPAKSTTMIGWASNPGQGSDFSHVFDQLRREMDSKLEVVEANGRGTREVLETRLAGMDKAITLLQNTTDKLPDQIKGEVKQLESLHGERFRSIDKVVETRFEGIDKQFMERDKRTEQLSLADKTAIAAALQAQKEAAGAQNESNSTASIKMEGNFAKLIEQTQTLLAEVRRNTDDKINDVKSRLDKGDGGSSVSQPANAGAMAMLIQEVRALQATSDARGGRSAGGEKILSYLIGAGGVLLAAISIILSHSH